MEKKLSVAETAGTFPVGSRSETLGVCPPVAAGIDKKLSVIVPVYNAEKHLKQTIDSLLAQTYKNLEIILVNDCSTDKSYDICMDYVYKDPRVKVVNHEVNMGTGGARRSGVEAATGQYIGWLDSDDRHAHGMYEDLIRLLEKNNADIIQCKFFYEYEDKVLGTKDTGELKKYNNIEAVKSLLELHEIDTLYWNKVFCKHLFNNVEMSLLRFGLEDSDTLYKLLYEAKTVIFYDKSYCYYRQHTGTHTYGDLCIEKAVASIKLDVDKNEYIKKRCPDLSTICNKKLFTKHISVYYTLDKNEAGTEQYQKEISKQSSLLYKQIRQAIPVKKRCFYFLLLFGTKQNPASRLLYIIIRNIYKKKGYRLDSATKRWRKVS